MTISIYAIEGGKRTLVFSGDVYRSESPLPLIPPHGSTIIWKGREWCVTHFTAYSGNGEWFGPQHLHVDLIPYDIYDICNSERRMADIIKELNSNDP